MAITKRISDLPAKGSDIATTDLVPIAEVDATTTSGYRTKYVTGSEIKPSNLISFNLQTANYTLVLSDANKMIEMNSSSPMNFFIPLFSAVAFPIGTQILISQKGSGAVTVKFTGGTILAEGNKLTTAGQYAIATIIKVGDDVWYLSGNLTT